MNITQLENFNALLAAWRNHEELREAGAPIAELARSRERLDNARIETQSSIAGLSRLA